MAADIPEIEPVEIIAGDTVRWTKSLPDYKASDSWALSYVVVGRLGRPGVIAATTSGDGFAVTIAAATTAVWAAGDYTIRGYVTKSGEQFTVYEGRLTVKENLAASSGIYDDRSDAQIAYDNAMTIWKTVKAHGSYSIAGRMYTSRNMAEIIQLVDRCKRDLVIEQLQEKYEKTGINPRHVKVRFNR